MEVYKFYNLPRMKDEDDLNELEIGDRFLYGPKMIAQNETKKEGDDVAMFEVLSKKENSVEYILVFDKLE